MLHLVDSIEYGTNFWDGEAFRVRMLLPVLAIFQNLAPSHHFKW
jgi:hypothetical protein